MAYFEIVQDEAESPCDGLERTEGVRGLVHPPKEQFCRRGRSRHPARSLPIRGGVWFRAFLGAMPLGRVIGGSDSTCVVSGNGQRDSQRRPVHAPSCFTPRGVEGGRLACPISVLAVTGSASGRGCTLWLWLAFLPRVSASSLSGWFLHSASRGWSLPASTLTSTSPSPSAPPLAVPWGSGREDELGWSALSTAASDPVLSGLRALPLSGFSFFFNFENEPRMSSMSVQACKVCADGDVVADSRLVGHVALIASISMVDGAVLLRR